MGKKLTDLTERTATADTDLIHVNSSGTDYKESRSNFLKGDLYTTLSNSQTITASAESLPAPGTYFGYISSYSHQSATGMPENANFYVKIERIASTGYIFIDVWNIDGAENSHYTKTKRNGTWDSTWTKIPSRSEITNISLHHASHTYNNVVISNLGYVKLGSIPTDFGVSASNFYVGFLIRGWSGGNGGALSVVLGSNGTDAYLLGVPNSTVNQINIRLWYVPTAST